MGDSGGHQPIIVNVQMEGYEPPRVESEGLRRGGLCLCGSEAGGGSGGSCACASKAGSGGAIVQQAAEQ